MMNISIYIRKLLLKFNLIKIKKVSDKILILINKDIDLYSYVYRSKECLFLEKDITKYIKILSKIMNDGFKEKPLIVPTINDKSYYKNNLSCWYVDDGRIIDEDNLNIFLKLSYNFTKEYENNNNNFDPIIINNIRKTSPYYLNIDNIINSIMEVEKIK